MPLQRVALELVLAAAPRPVWQLIDTAYIRIDQFIYGRLDRPIPAFHPSDFRLVYHALLGLRQQAGLRGQRFCEWGSGFGVVAGLAAMTGMSAYGIESDGSLVAAARELADELELPVQFFEGSFLTRRAVRELDWLDDLAWLDLTAPSAWSELGLEPSDFALTYAYPWPGEEQVVFELFEQVADEGALLLSYHGAEDLRLHRKKAGRARSRGR